MKTTSMMLAALTILVNGAALAATPPEFINYQGILRDTADNALDGSYDMAFRYYDSETGGIYLLLEEHFDPGTGGTGQVTASGGLFSVGLGTGELVEVAPGIDSLSDVFSQPDVWLEVYVDGEMLTPRVQIRGAGHALNSARLNGQTPDYYLDTSATAQTKVGTLVIDSAVPGGYALEARGVTGGGYFEDDSGYSEAHLAEGERGIDSRGREWGGYFSDTDSSTWAKVGWDSYGLYTNGDVTAQGNMRAEGDMTILGSTVTYGLWNNDPDLYLNQVGPDATASIYFHEGGVRTGARMFWNNTYNRFEYSHKLQVPASVTATTFIDADNTSYYVNPSSSSVSGNLYGDLQIGSGSGTDADRLFFDQQGESLTWDNSETRFELSDELAISGPIQTGTTSQSPSAYNRIGSEYPDGGSFMADANDMFVSYNLEVGNELGLSGVLRMEAQGTLGGDADQAIYFYDEDAPYNNYIKWDDVTSITCGTISNINSGFVWNISDNSQSGWIFANGSDNEVVINEFGSMEIDGTLHQSGSCDLAETFFGPEGLHSGTVVVLDPDRPEGVKESDRPYDPTVVGVVTTRPGVLLSGPSADSYPLWQELERITERLATLEVQPLAGDLDDRRDLESKAMDLEMELDQWTRGGVAVALVGRVPVKVDASYGPVRKGDYLTTSATPGHARLLEGPGPYLGIAMEELAAGRGDILVFLNKGWYGGAAQTSNEKPPEPADQIAEVQEMESDLSIVLDRNADDKSRFAIYRDGGERLSSEVFRVDERGNVFASGSFRPAAMDLAEFHPVSEPAQVGDVLVIDRDNPGSMALGRIPSDPAVVGIVSTKPGVLLGSGLQRIIDADTELAAALEEARALDDTVEEARLWAELEERFTGTHAAVALSGTVPCKVDAGFGSIEVGDLLAVSPTPGHAMRAADPAPQGTVLGKALEPLKSGTGIIKVLVMMR